MNKAYIQIHICVFLWGFTAILGRLISLQELPLVWYRLIITCIALLFMPNLINNLKKVDKKELKNLFFIGCIVATHWLFFYSSIKYSNVSVALSCFSITSFLTAIIDPIMSKTRIKITEVLLGIIIIPAIYLIFYFNQIYFTGMILAFLASLTASIFTILNKKAVSKTDSLSMTFIELFSGLIFITLTMPLYNLVFPNTNMIPSNSDWMWLFVLSIMCTVIPFNMSLKALKEISAFTANFVVNLEPIYGIIMAIFIFQENKELNTGFYIGAFIIISAIFLQPLLNKSLKS